MDVEAIALYFRGTLSLLHKEVNTAVQDQLRLTQGKEQSSAKDTGEAVIKAII